jgi:acid phosphatase family membrane protein YuiD
MPSVHSSVVVSLTSAVAMKYGISHDLFAISMAFTVIIIYDAINVRFEAGQHAVAINESL